MLITSNPMYIGMFGPVADATGTDLPGTPVDADDLQGAPNQRESALEAAVLAFGTFVGSVAAHEAGHVIINDFDLHRDGAHTLMQAGGATFEEVTGINFFRVETFQIVTTEPLTFSPGHRVELAHRLPVDDTS